jgi:hypothetical protein
MNQSLIFFFAGIIILGAIMFALICLSKKGIRHLDVERYRTRCLAVEHQLKKDEPSSYHLSVLNADKLVGQALKERGIKGQTMGEKMKNANSIFSDSNGIWSAHKLRNRIAHEPDASVTYDEARYALSHFRRALKDLGAI